MSIANNGPVAVTFTRVDASLDGAPFISVSLNVSVPANTSASYGWTWCVSHVSHTAGHTWTGTDVNGRPISATSNVINLNP
jgi:hypothetical protein